MHSFGHAAYFGLGAYGAALVLQGARPADGGRAAARAAARRRSARCVFGWFCVRLSGVYLAMLTLAFAQIVWSVVFQWDALTGGSNGLVGIWPAAWLAPQAGVLPARARLHRRRLRPAGAHRCTRRSAWRCAPAATRRCAPRRIGLERAAPAVARPSSSPARSPGSPASLFAFAKGTISPETLGVAKSVDGLVMVLLGGVQARLGAVGRRVRSSPGCRTPWRARPTTGGRCSASSCWRWCSLFPLGVAGGWRLFMQAACVTRREPA